MDGDEGASEHLMDIHGRLCISKCTLCLSIFENTTMSLSERIAVDKTIDDIIYELFSDSQGSEELYVAILYLHVHQRKGHEHELCDPSGEKTEHP